MPYTVLHADAFEDNYIWVIVAESTTGNGPRPAIIVDPGDEDPVLDLIERENLGPVAILCTHHHWDHVNGAAFLASRFGVDVYGPGTENITAVTHALNDGATFCEPETGIQFEVFSIPGHTKGHIAYYGANMLFCGDTLFSAGCGRLFEGTAEQMLSSLNRLAALPDQTRVFCGHEYTAANLRFAATLEPDNVAIGQHIERVNQRRLEQLPSLPSTIGLEKAINPFLRTNLQQIKMAAEIHCGKTLEDEVAVFAEVRHWKDDFRA